MRDYKLFHDYFKTHDHNKIEYDPLELLTVKMGGLIDDDGYSH